MRLVVCLALALSLQAATPNRAPLQPNAYNPLPLGSVMPKGWLLDQLKLQASGLSGHLDEFWPDLGPNTAWLGGSGEGWERGPYFLDGLVPLAYLTKDPALIAKVRKWMDWTLDHQSPEGWIGPAKNTDWWPNYVMLKALMQYQEASGDPRVIPLMQKYFTYQLAHMDERPLKEWAIFRWHDEVLSVIWLYNRTGDAKLLELARKLHQQGHDWEAQFADFKTTEKVTKTQAGLSTHGVNNAMAMKAAAVWWLVTGDPGDRAALYKMFDALDRYHGQPNGIFSADEHFSGRDPSQGTELCAVVEAMFSLEQDLSILGDAAFGDRLEKIAYNALPATLSPDLWAHQYDQQANQIMCSLSNHRWATNGPESNIFGLEPNFGCCTANMHQGWPKLAANLWMATPDQGLAAVVYGPSEVETTVRGGVTVRIAEETGYPFRDTVSLIVRPERAATFPLELRIPAWASGAIVTVGGAPVNGVRAGEFLRIEREWRAGDRVELRFPMALRLSNWYNNSIAVERGPLVYSLRVGESWHKLKQTGPASDWEVYPTSPWNYGLVVDPKN
ncbi:MAG TPA: beta-L-arabinofuranosidase domain-containing protein, partial [Candidatus Acidoferrum sp.]|nr:beta-L-arabinofuranosidase domain-containing protein [Candidatus Acidoferrum sp.]